MIEKPVLCAQMSPQAAEALAGNMGQQIPVAQPADDANEMLRKAFQQGAEYAMQQMATQQAEEQAAAARVRMEALSRSNEDQAAELRERIDKLQQREYRCDCSSL